MLRRGEAMVGVMVYCHTGREPLFAAERVQLGSPRRGLFGAGKSQPPRDRELTEKM